MEAEKATGDCTATGDSTAATMPHLECVDRVRKIPMVETALNQTADMYGRVKECNSMLNWTLTAAEATVNKAMEQAAPIAKKLEQPISAVDQTLCKGLTLVQEKVPIVKEPAQQIYDTAKTYVCSALQPTMSTVSAVKDFGAEKAQNLKDFGFDKAQSLKDLSLSKANEVFATHYGNMALTGVDTTTSIAEQYLDYFFPANEEEVERDNEVPVAEDGDDKVLNTVYTVGRLSNKVARRLYRVLSTQVKNLNKENVQEYVTNLVAIMQLAKQIDTLKKSSIAPKTEDSSKPEPAETKKPEVHS